MNQKSTGPQVFKTVLISKEDILTQIKDKIINFQYIGESDEDENKIEKEKKDDIKRQQNEKDRQQVRVKETEIPLFDEDNSKSSSSISNNEVLNDKTQKVIPLYAEQPIITKKRDKNRRNHSQKK